MQANRFLTYALQQDVPHSSDLVMFLKSGLYLFCSGSPLYNILIEYGTTKKLVGLIKMCLTETYGRVRVGKNLSDMFPIRNGLKQGDALSPLLFNSALEYANKRVQVNQDGLKLNGKHQLLAYADDVNILGGSVYTVKKNAEALVAATKEIGLEVNAHKTKYMIVF